jgi:hypothetical protein
VKKRSQLSQRSSLTRRPDRRRLTARRSAAGRREGSKVVRPAAAEWFRIPDPVSPAAGSWEARQAARRRRVSCSALLGGAGHLRTGGSERHIEAAKLRLGTKQASGELGS